jgi:D-aspartate ligase
MTNSVALILGGYINGYSIIRELHECSVKNIWLFDYGPSLARFSNKIVGYSCIQMNAGSLKTAIYKLRERYNLIVVFPTDDLQLVMLNEIFKEVCDFCFLPFKSASLTDNLSKIRQYEACDRLRIPYPRSCHLTNETDLRNIAVLSFPLIFKPIKKHEELRFGLFRNLYVESEEKLQLNLGKIEEYLRNGVPMMVSEFIPGDGSNIFAYTAYRSKNGAVLNGWTGKKLSQYPNELGNFSSSSNVVLDVVKAQGNALIHHMDLYGIIQPEFKFDARDGKYKLMEINLRSMMWHRTGNLSGVYLQYSQWLDATGQSVPLMIQRSEPIVRFVYMKHEITNLLARRGYWRKFIHNVFGSGLVRFAVFDIGDIKPFFFDLFKLPRLVAGRWLKVLLKR